MASDAGAHGSVLGPAVRVPRLGDGDPRGEYRTDVAPGSEAVARADVADFVLDVAEHDPYVRELPKVGY